MDGSLVDGDDSPVASQVAGNPPAHAHFETVLAELSSRFVNVPSGEVDREVEDALRRVCELVGVDMAVLWQWPSSTPADATATHIYDTQKTLPANGQLSQEMFPWVAQELLAGRIVALSSLPDRLPAEATIDRQSVRLLGLKSNLTLPLAVGGGPPVGALAFNTTRAEHDWPDALVQRLRLVAQVFANALARRRQELSLRESEARLAAGADLAGLAFYEVDFGSGEMFVDGRFRRLCWVPSGLEEGLQTPEFWMAHIHPDDAPQVMDARQEAQRSGREEFNLEYRFLPPGQGQKWIRHIARVASRDDGERLVKSYGVLRDITERKRAEEGLRQSLAEVERLKERLQAESDYLKAEMRVAGPPGGIIGQSAAMFAARFGFSINTLRHWEQVKREPEGPTRAYLLVIERAPRVVEKALKIA
jgi:PAS domain-containing protein